MAADQGRKVFVIGIGAGDPEHLTVGAVRALNEVDVVFLVDKGGPGSELRDARLRLCDGVMEPGHRYRVEEVELDAVRNRGAGPYDESIAALRAQRVAAYAALIASLGEDETGAFLVWGDPTLYDGTLAILDEVRAKASVRFEVEVVPGISSIAALAARHGVALNRAGENVLITSGRRLAKDGIPDSVDNVVVMLDAHGAWEDVDEDFAVWWGAFVGMPNESLARGSVGTSRAEIARERERLRDEKGWLFDTFLLRRR
jgi:precorrin-6A synthase